MTRSIHLLSVALLALSLLGSGPAWGQRNNDADATDMGGGVITLQPPRGADSASSTGARRPAADNGNAAAMRLPPPPPSPPPLSEFEQFVNANAGTLPTPIRRLGIDLMLDAGLRADTVDYSPQVPPDYLIASGDEIVVSIWGAVNAELRLIVDDAGRISIPRVGAIMVSGVRYGDLAGVLRRRVEKTFRDFELAVSLGQLRGVRILVTGFAANPGAYTVNSLTSVLSALARAGGPSAAGSFRHIELRRGSQQVGVLDLYDLLLRGDRSGDRLVQAGDVIFVGPVGLQVAAVGAFNRTAIFELKPGENAEHVLKMAGGISPVANREVFTLERIEQRETLRVVTVARTELASTLLRNGDVLRAFNAATVAAPIVRQNKLVRVEGEVVNPGDYVLPPDSTIGTALRAAGGLTPAAFVFGTQFSRASVRVLQQQNYDRALRNLEADLSRTSATQRVASADEAAALSGRIAATNRLLQTLRTVQPTGRVVLDVAPDARELPDLKLEDGDRIYVPPVPSSIGVFGSVFNAGNFVRAPDRTLGDYIDQAGGPTRGADRASAFVIRANGSVISGLQNRDWYRGYSGGLENVAALPGDTVFVPEELDKTTVAQHLKDWTQILYQFSLGAAAFVTLTK